MSNTTQLSSPQSPLQRPAILTVDDQADNLAAMKEILSSLDAEIITALSGEEAISLANRRSFAVIFLDVIMPGMNGFETAEMLRMNKSTRHMPLILVTGQSGDELNMFRGYASGAVDYLYKPVARNLLLNKATVFLDLWNYRADLELTKASLEAQNKELDDFVRALRRGDIDTISGEGEGTGAKVLRLLDKNIIEENERLMNDLARSNKDFQDFAHAASHDLKAPLIHMSKFAKFVLEDEGKNLSEKSRGMQQNICDAAQRLGTMIDSLFEYAKVDAKSPNFTTVDLNTVVKNVLNDLSEEIRKTGAQLEVGVFPRVNGDAGELYQLLLNIVANALKFSRPNVVPVIKLSSRRPGNRQKSSNKQTEAVSQTQIIIEDNGIGFDDSRIDYILTPFQRLVTTDHFAGSGIGLGTAKKIIERHGGTITANSTPGKGSTFLVTLSLEQLAVLPDVTNSWSFTVAPATASITPRLLIVDDDVKDLQLAKKMLADFFQVYTVSNAEEALALLASEKVDIVISDYKMPGENGFWLLGRVKSCFPAIRRGLNSSLQPAGLDDHLKSGVVEFFLPKPINIEQIQTSLQVCSRKY